MPTRLEAVGTAAGIRRAHVIVFYIFSLFWEWWWCVWVCVCVWQEWPASPAGPLLVFRDEGEDDWLGSSEVDSPDLPAALLSLWRHSPWTSLHRATAVWRNLTSVTTVTISLVAHYCWSPLIDLRVVTLWLLFNDGEQRFAVYALFLLQLKQLLTQHILVSLSQPVTQTHFNVRTNCHLLRIKKKKCWVALQKRLAW